LEAQGSEVVDEKARFEAEMQHRMEQERALAAANARLWEQKQEEEMRYRMEYEDRMMKKAEQFLSSVGNPRKTPTIKYNLDNPHHVVLHNAFE
jgi:hypothetical protein